MQGKEPAKQRIVLLGSTGSIGRNTLDVISHHLAHFEVVALAAGQQAELMIEQAKRFAPARIVMATPAAAAQVRAGLSGMACDVEAGGSEALCALVEDPEVTCVVVATSGTIALRATLRALALRKRVALANKETLVVAGHLLPQRETLVPIDSEHVALLQCIQGGNWDEVERVILTASGGALRDLPLAELAQATPAQVLQHPNWSMGQEITVNAATMMNKGFEIIEAHWLFGLPYAKLEAVLHPQSCVHGMLGFYDGSWLSQLGVPDMRSAIQYALTYPQRLPLTLPRLNFHDMVLQFSALDPCRYPCFSLALAAGEAGGTCPAVVHTANEVAVQTFLQKRCSFPAIAAAVEHALQRHQVVAHPSLPVLEALETEVRRETATWLAAQRC